MKANKIFAVALAALTLVACNKKDEPKVPLTVNPTSMTLTVGETGTITASVGATWASNNEAVATVAPGNDGGKTALVTAVAEGNAIISATANGETKTCVILVQKGGGGGDEKTIDAKRIWPVILDSITADKYSDLIAGDIRVNEAEGNNLYIWAAGETYIAGDATGKNFFGNTEGYLALTVAAPDGWSGFGIHIENAASVQAMQAIKDAVAANPDKMFYKPIADKVRYLKETDEGEKIMTQVMDDWMQEIVNETSERKDLEYAQKLIQFGVMTLEDIANLTTLPLEKVQSLAKEIRG